MDQLICIHDKTNIQNNAIFECGIVSSGSKTTLKGYHKKFPEFPENLNKAESK